MEMKKLIKVFSLITALVILVTCCSKDEERGNYVKLENVTYAIQSATYSVDDGNLVVMFTTEGPDVFLYFEARTTVPVGIMEVSDVSTNTNVLVSYCFDNDDYLSTSGTMTILQDNGYTIVADGHLVSESNGDKAFKIQYVGDLTNTSQNGSGGGNGGGGSVDNDFWLGPVFSYVRSTESDGVIHVYCDNNNLGWTVTSDASWCRLNSVGGIGYGSFRFQTEANHSIVDRSAKITVTTSDGRTKRAHVIQRAGMHLLELSPGNLTFSCLGGAQVLHITIDNGGTPIQWGASCSASWVHLSQTSGLATADVTVTVDNNTSSEREAEICVTVGNKVKYCKISQQDGTNSPTCYLFYGSDVIEMTTDCYGEIYNLGWLGNHAYLYLGCTGIPDNNLKSQVQLNFNYNDIPTGDISYNTAPYWMGISVKDRNNQWHEASSGSVSIRRRGSTFTVTGSGIADHTSFSFRFEGDLM